MSNKIGRFEIISEIAKSGSSAVYKANDPEAGRTIALKTIRLDLPPDLARILIQLILQEAESTKTLNSQNIGLLYGAGEIEGQFCAAMEYVEGNSLANMIARQEGFSIWDLLDLSRQVCLALDHANSHEVLHRSLEPAKIMMQWDGTVKVLGYGISTMVSAMPRKGAEVPPLFYYMSPEQVKGDVMDLRSNIFSWGAILYEMVTERKPFVGDDIQTVRKKILDETPEPPATINPRMNLSVSTVIMRALSKSPEERYEHGHDLLADLEKAKETTQAKTAKDAKPPKGLVIPEKLKAPPATSAKFVVPQKSETASSQKFGPAQSDIEQSADESEAQSQAEAVPGLFESRVDKPTKPNVSTGGRTKKAAAAGAGVGPSAPSVTKRSAGASGQSEASAAHETMSAATEEPSVAAPPKFRTDPMMGAAEQSRTKTVSFSDLDELPPLKEDFVPVAEPPAPALEPEQAPAPTFRLQPRVIKEEKPKVVTRENARKAVNEIKKVPPKLMVYSLAGSAAVILAVILGIAYYIHSKNADEDAAPASVAETQAQPEQNQPAVESAPAEPEQTGQAEPVVKPRYAPKKVKAAPAPKAVIVPGELMVSSNPEGAQVQIDGQSNAAWVTPYTIPGLAPGQHTVTVAKQGYVSDTRSLQVGSGSKSSLSFNLQALGAFVSISSEPGGASIFIDGKSTGHVTPAQITGEKGSHTILVRKEGYLDETVTADFVAGQTFKFAPVLKALGITDDIKTVGKFGKLFGGDKGAGMAKVSVKTQPKGAQITVNRRMVDKASPVDFLLNPGNYMIDITLSGYKPVHRVINLERNGKIELNENMEPQ